MQRLGYALGSAYIGIIANAAGFAGAFLPTAPWVFVGEPAAGACGLVALARFVSPGVAGGRSGVMAGTE